MLADLRVAHQGAPDGLLTQIVGSLPAARAVTLQRVAQDGMRARAGAGAACFRQKERWGNAWGWRESGKSGSQLPIAH